MLNRGTLSGLSAAFAECLFLAYPEWEGLANNLDGGAFKVEIPQPGTDRTLWSDTQDAEITVGYDHYHAHFGPFLGLSDQESITQAMDEIRAIVQEDMVVMNSFRDGKWVQSMLGRPDKSVVTQPGGTTHIYSWLGTHNRTLDGTPQLITPPSAEQALDA